MSRHLGAIATSVFHSSTRRLAVPSGLRLSESLSGQSLKKRLANSVGVVSNQTADNSLSVVSAGVGSVHESSSNSSSSAHNDNIYPIFTDQSDLHPSRKPSFIIPFIDIHSPTSEMSDSFSTGDKMSPFKSSTVVPDIIHSSSLSSSPSTVYVINPRIVRLNLGTRRGHGGQNTKKARFRVNGRNASRMHSAAPHVKLPTVSKQSEVVTEVDNAIAHRIIDSQMDLFSHFITNRAVFPSSANLPAKGSIVLKNSMSLENEVNAEVTPAMLASKKSKAFKELLLSAETLDEDRKRLADLDTLLFPRIQDLRKSRDSIRISEPERTEEAINLERLKNKSSMLNHYFEDGKRKVDYVIVYQKPTGNAAHKVEAQEALDQRSIFEANLIEEGVELEYQEDIGGNGIVFIKLFAPWHVLTRYAEIMKLKMPMKTMQTTWKMLFEDDEHHSMRFTAPYSKDKEYLFDIPPQKDSFFSAAQRAQVVEFVLKRKSFSKNPDDVTEFGINKLISDKVYIAAYPIHEGKINSDYRSPRMQLIQNWASIKVSFNRQPLDEIRRYFGVKIALYFAWLGFYTSMLIPASVVGVICFMFGSFTLDKDIPSKEVCNGTYDHVLMCPQCAHDCNFTRMSDSCTYARTTYLFDNPATVFFAIFMSIWATVYLEMWKRYSARITYRWDLSNFDAVEEYPRPEYLARLANASNRRLNVITRMYEPYIPFWRRQLPYTILSVSVVLFLILIALGSVVSVIIYRSTIRSAIRFKRVDSYKVLEITHVTFLQKYASIIVSSSAAGLNLIFILILNHLYSKIAYYLTELEMPRTQTEFDNSLTLKMFLLQFVNYYSSIFYIAFFKGRFIGNPGEFNDESLTQEECATGGCLLELAIQLAIIMVGRQMFGAALELCMPFIRMLYRRWLYRNENKVTRMNVPQWEDDFHLTPWSPTSLFYEYLEMVIQFGFVTIFVSAFPLAPLFALINNVFEIRLDARKMITAFKRPVAQRSKNIGIWYRILDTICKLSVITNAMIIAFTTEFVPRFFYYFEHGNLHGYINSTLSHFDAKVVNEHLKLGYDEAKLGYCVYPDYREPPWTDPDRRYKFTSYYWRLLAVRLSFVVIFENVIATITSLMRWLIPDVPQQLRQQMRQHGYLTNELILQQEFQRAKELREENQVERRNATRPQRGSMSSVLGQSGPLSYQTVSGRLSARLMTPNLGLNSPTGEPRIRSVRHSNRGLHSSDVFVGKTSTSSVRKRRFSAENFSPEGSLYDSHTHNLKTRSNIAIPSQEDFNELDEAMNSDESIIKTTTTILGDDTVSLNAAESSGFDVSPESARTKMFRSEQATSSRDTLE